MVQPAPMAQRHGARVVDAIVTQARLGEELLSREGGRRLVERAPHVHGRTPLRLVGSHLVVVAHEAVDLTLELVDGLELIP